MRKKRKLDGNLALTRETLMDTVEDTAQARKEIITYEDEFKKIEKVTVS